MRAATMKFAAVYIRRSSISTESPGDASREAQHDAGARLAAAFAPGSEVREFVDWGISGRKDDRPEYVKLKAEIAAGRVCCVFAYSLSRLGRTARELDNLFSLCEAHDVQVITQADGTLTATSATGRFLRKILAELAELESELAKERVAAAFAVKRRRNDHLGRPGYGHVHATEDNGRIVEVRDESVDLEPLRRAVIDAGSILGACGLLEKRGIKAPRGGDKWSTSALTRIVERDFPELMPRAVKSGRRTERGRTSLLTKIVQCPYCSTYLTPNTARGQLYCHRGAIDRKQDDSNHPRYVASEAVVMEFVRAEAARLIPPGERVENIDLSARLAALDEDVRRLDKRYAAKSINDAEFDAEMARLQDERENVESEGDGAEIAQAIDFDEDPVLVNSALRSIWRYVKLDAEMKPVRAQWVRDEWRRP